jgi:hypothetical protein
MISETHKRALRYIAKNAVRVSNNGVTDAPKAVSAPAYRALVSAGYVQPNGAARAWWKGRSVRRIEVTRTGLDYLTVK